MSMSLSETLMLEKVPYRLTLVLEVAEHADAIEPIAPFSFHQVEFVPSNWLAQRHKYQLAQYIDELRDAMLAEVCNEDWRTDRKE